MAYPHGIGVKPMLSALIVDDEPLAHQVLLHHLKSHSDIHVLGQCYNASQALAALAKQRVDLLLLDINMPELSGIDMLKVMANRPHVIIISAHQQFAIDGFALDVVDYLLKPVGAERFAQALQKVRQRIVKPTPPAAPPSIVVKVDREQRLILLSDITFLEAYGNFIKLWQGKTMVLVSATLKSLLDTLPGTQFVQIHKSYVVNRQHIVGFDGQQLRLSSGQVLKLGKTYRKSFGQWPS
jgi:two-component system, LytTR family, response regulator